MVREAHHRPEPGRGAKADPPSVATDSERLAHFQRDAEVLTALNHPNIAIIDGLETGQASQPVSPAFSALPVPPVPSAMMLG